MIRVKFLVTMMVISTIWAEAQINVSGRVVDVQSGDKLGGVLVHVEKMGMRDTTDVQGFFELNIPQALKNARLIFIKEGYARYTLSAVSGEDLVVKMVKLKEEEIVMEALDSEIISYERVASEPKALMKRKMAVSHNWQAPPLKEADNEEYATKTENGFVSPLKEVVSTFSIDVDRASYSNVRRFIQNGQAPPVDAVRIEELVNYFDYDYKQPVGNDPFAINTEMASCPWNEKHQLVQIGLQGKAIEKENLPASNLVFLIDVSGSMSAHNKLKLLKPAFKMLVNELRPEDRVAIVVYAGASGVVLPSTQGSDKGKIVEALDQLQAGGSTAGGAGIQLAYQIAKQEMIKGGNNRVILATDGDFNVGLSSNQELENLIEAKRNDGIFLTALGFGMGNYKDSKMEILADKGNGNYAYIDNLLEAQKVFVNEFGGTLFTIAKDVKIQVEFNPAKVKSYRLIGYENRMLNEEDFDNDAKDAGELGAGHTVTALYELITYAEGETPNDRYRYQKTVIDPKAMDSKELMNVKLRYKQPDETTSKLLQQVVIDKRNDWKASSENMKLAAAVAEWGLLLTNSDYKGNASYQQVLELGKSAIGKDEYGYRIEFLNLVRTSQFVSESR